MLSLFSKLLKVLNSEASPFQIGWAVALGVLAGLLPFGALTLLILLLVCLFTINISTFLLVWTLSKGLVWLLAAPIEQWAWGLGQNSGVLSVLAESEFLQFLHLHHTLTFGGLILGLVLFVPILFFSVWLVRQYRERVMTRVQKFRIVQLLKASKLAQLYSQA